MALQKKLKKRDRIPSTYEKDHPLFAEANERYCSNQPIGRAVERAEHAASQIAHKGDPENNCQTEQDAENDLVDDNAEYIETDVIRQSISDRKVIDDLIESDRKEIIKAKPNFFITLSMKPCFNSNWGSYDRDFQVARLYKRSAILIYKLLLELDPKLKDIDYREWPFFFGTLEHFDEDGNLVAPHMHLLVESEADIETISAIVERLWNKLVEDVGPSGVDVQVIEKNDIGRRASYILKHQHRDGMEELWAGIKPHKICAQFGWTHDAISHDKWRLHRDNFYTALNGRHKVLEYGNPSRRVDQALYRIFGNLSDTELTEKKQSLWRSGYLEGDAINNLKMSPQGAGLSGDMHGRKRRKSEGRDTM